MLRKTLLSALPAFSDDVVGIVHEFAHPLAAMKREDVRLASKLSPQYAPTILTFCRDSQYRLWSVQHKDQDKYRICVCVSDHNERPLLLDLMPSETQYDTILGDGRYSGMLAGFTWSFADPVSIHIFDLPQRTPILTLKCTSSILPLMGWPLVHTLAGDWYVYWKTVGLDETGGAARRRMIWDTKAKIYRLAESEDVSDQVIDGNEGFNLVQIACPISTDETVKINAKTQLTTVTAKTATYRDFQLASSSHARQHVIRAGGRSCWLVNPEKKTAVLFEYM